MFLCRSAWPLLLCAKFGTRRAARHVATSADNSPPVVVQSTTVVAEAKEEPLWKNLEKHALPKQTDTFTDFKELNVDWDYVERLMPLKIVPDPPYTDSVTPSGWRPPRVDYSRGLDPAPDLPYYIRRGRTHLPELHLERRRDELNPKTMDFEYVELVTIRNISGDVFACERDLRAFLEREVGQPVATHVDELKGRIKVKGADRAIVEKFVFESGF